jgi:hypothetical protein
MYKVARKYQLGDLISFCSAELQGISTAGQNSETTEFEYRIKKIIFTPLQIEINRYLSPTYSEVKNALRNTEGVFEDRLIFPQSITQLESIAKGFETNPNRAIATLKMSSKAFNADIKDDYPIYAYLFPDDFASLFAAIRQKAIDKLIAV